VSVNELMNTFIRQQGRTQTERQICTDSGF